MFICEDRATNVLETFRIAGRFFKSLLNLITTKEASEKEAREAQPQTKKTDEDALGCAVRAG